MTSEQISILHLSDLHFGAAEVQDVSWKVAIEGAHRETRHDRLLSFFESLSTTPDYVVISGDVTCRGSKDGFDIARELFDIAAKKRVLPGSKRILVVPGNHDVMRAQTPSRTASGRWTRFAEFARGFTRPWLPELDPPAETLLRAVESSYQTRAHYWGGVIGFYDVALKRKVRITLPFLFDQRQGVLFYLFNSACISGTRISIATDLREILEWAQQEKRGNNARIQHLAEAFDKSLSIDPARIDPREFKLFIGIMNIIKEKLDSAYEAIIKIAVLHHHIAPMLIEEVKQFEPLINAGRFKYEVYRLGFQLVLHGHKHEPTCFYDTTVPKGGTLFVSSGGTIGGDSEPSFTSINVDRYARITTSHVSVEMAGDPRDIMRATKKTVRSLPRHGTAVVVTDEIPPVDLSKFCTEASAALAVRWKNDKEGDELVFGWGHNLRENAVSPIATAFGLRILWLAGVLDPKIKMRVQRLLGSLITFRGADGCWSATSQRAQAHSEATAWVLLALLDWSASAELKSSVRNFKKHLSTNKDTVFRNSTLSLCLAIEALSAAAPKSRILGELTLWLTNGSIKDAKGRRCWGRLCYTSKSANEKEASVLHTARCCYALSRAYANSHGDMGLSPEMLRATREYLLENIWEDGFEKIVRSTTNDLLVVNHYTSTWAIRSLLALGVAPDHEKIISGINKILKSRQSNGLWRWGSSTPIWATHDALDTLKLWRERLYMEYLGKG